MDTSNKRNGYSAKRLKSHYKEFQIDVPQDRNGEFKPKIIPKYQRDVSGIEEKVISLYGRGMSTRRIHDQLQDLYGIEMSAEMVSKITDKILPELYYCQKDKSTTNSIRIFNSILYISEFYQKNFPP